jgi:riboflavin synthase
MFTGIIQELGEVVEKLAIAGEKQGLNISIKVSNNQFLQDVQIGDSIAINGACMTVVSLNDNIFSFDISAHSLDLIVNMQIGMLVNLEKALRANSFLGGHIVTGHVDGMALVHTFKKIDESYLLKIIIDNSKNALGKFMAVKGSVTINGVSLTVNYVEDIDNFTILSCNLIPHTIQKTSLQYLSVNSPVNIEIDVLCRYMDRMLSFNIAK